MAPSKKVVESQSGSADILSHRPSLDDEAFVEQLLRVAQCVSNGTTITATTMAAASVSFDEIYPTIVKRLTTTTTNTVVQPVHGSNSSLANSLETSTLGQTNCGVAAAAGSKTPPTVVQVIAPPSSQDGSVVAPSVENVSFSCGGGGGNDLANASFSRNALAADEVTTSQETIVLHLTSLLARALNAEDYWTNLLHQIRVDHYVWAIRYCASHGFSALKTLHLLQWLRSFQALVEQRTHGCRGTKEEHNNKEQHGGAEMNNNNNNNSVTRMEVVEETTGTAGRVIPTNTTTNGATGRRNSATSNTSQAGRTNATRKAAASNGRRSRLGGRRESDTTTAIAAAAAAFTPPSPHRPYSKDNNAESNAAESGVEGTSHVSYEARLYAAMKDFLLSELQEGWRWEQAARDLAQGRDLSLVNAGANTGAEESGGTPVTGNLTTPPSSSSSPQSTSRKAPRGEKARQQQLEEQEEEQRRQALLAALPRENIYLTRDEVVPFCAFFLTKGMLAHTALYRYVAHHDRPSQPAIRLDETHNTTTITTTVKDKQESHVDRVFHVSVEVPMSVPPLAVSVLRELNTTTAIAGDSVTNKTANTGGATAATAAAANEGSARAAGHGSNNSSVKTGKGVAAQRAEKGRTGESPSRRSPRGSGTTAVTVTTTTLPEKPEEHTSHHSPGSPRHTNAAQLQSNAASSLAALRAMQAEEEDRLTREHHAAEAAAALAATIAQREAEMQLHFAQEGTQRAVQDVYTSLEEDVTRRQMRVLQRVEALEKTLGITTTTTHTTIGSSNETGGNVSGEAGGNTEATAAGSGASKAKRPPTTQKKAKR